MKTVYFLLGIVFIAACGNQITVDSALSAETHNSPEQKATAWIENNLTPLHALAGHANRKSITRIMAEDNVPGLSIAFVDQGDVAWTKFYGLANLEASEKVTANTVFTGASLSKPLTAIAALSLVESGALHLDENVNMVLENWKVPENDYTEIEKVTLRRLITHHAGIKNDLWSSYLPQGEVPTLTQMLAGQSPSVDPATSVIAVPGSVEKYSNPGYSIVQKLLEDASGDSFDHVLEKLVLRPSGMEDSSFRQPMPDALRKRRAIGYAEDLQPYPYRLFPYKAAGGVWTTPTDIAKFVIALFEDYDGQKNMLSKSMADQVFKRDRERLGFSKIFNEESDDLVFRHYGSNQGFTCYLIGSLLRRQAVVIMINSDNGSNLLDYVARAVAEYYQWDYLQPTVYEAYRIPIPEIEEYVGRFDNNSEILTFSFENNFMSVTSKTHNATVKLTPVSNSEFISADDSTKYEFYRPRGATSGIFKWVRVITASGQDNYAEKL